MHPGLIPGEDSLPGLQTTAFSLLSHTAGGERETERQRPSSLVSFLVKALTPSLWH